MGTQDFLVEIGTEELPPKALNKLSKAFGAGICQGLDKADFQPGDLRLVGLDLLFQGVDVVLNSRADVQTGQFRGEQYREHQDAQQRHDGP